MKNILSSRGFSFTCMPWKGSCKFWKFWKLILEMFEKNMQAFFLWWLKYGYKSTLEDTFGSSKYVVTDFFPFENYFFWVTLKANYSIFLFKYGVKLLIIIIKILCISKLMAKNKKIGVIQKKVQIWDQGCHSCTKNSTVHFS